MITRQIITLQFNHMTDNHSTLITRQFCFIVITFKIGKVFIQQINKNEQNDKSNSVLKVNTQML